MTAPGPFTVLAADPPWKYQNFADSAHGAAISHYDTMDFEALKAIPVLSWAAPDSVLAMWGTWPKLDEGVDLLRAWGFTYVTGIPWVKTSPASRDIYCGIGFWTQSASEVVLIGRRGELRQYDSAPVRGLLVGEERQFYAPRNAKHSRKPAGLQDWLEVRFPGPYLELFATKRRPRWTCWGRSLGQELSAAGVSGAEDQPEQFIPGARSKVTKEKTLEEYEPPA